MFARAGLNDVATLDLLRSAAQPLASSSSGLAWEQSICDPDQRVLDRWYSYLTGFDLTGFDASDDEYPQYSDDSSWKQMFRATLAGLFYAGVQGPLPAPKLPGTSVCKTSLASW